MSVQVMAEIWKYSKAGGSALLVLLAIGDHTNGTGIAWPGIKHLAEKTKLSERQVRRVLRILEQTGELEIIRDRRYHRYRINLNHDILSTVDNMSGINGGNEYIQNSEGDIQGGVEDIQGPIEDTQGPIPDTDVHLIINNQKEIINETIKESTTKLISKTPAEDIWEKLLIALERERKNIFLELQFFNDILLDGDQLTIFVPNEFQRDYLNDRLAKTLSRFVVGIANRSFRIIFDIRGLNA